MDRHGETWIDDLLVWHFVKTRDLALLAASCSKFAMATCGVAPGPSAHSCSSRCHCSGLSLIKIESLWFYCIYESIIWLICSCHSNWTPNIHQKVFWILRCAAHWPEGSDDSRMANMSSLFCSAILLMPLHLQVSQLFSLSDLIHALVLPNNCMFPFVQ